MTKKEQVFALLERIGYKPKYDKENDIYIFYQMKYIYFLTNDDDEDPDPFLSILFPQFAEFEKGQEALFLAACNKITRNTKQIKVYVDETYCHISGAIEFFYADEVALEYNIKKGLRILGVIRTAFSKALRELSDSE